ncbi:MAG TPA: hypothetical protein DCY27_10710 [Desulfobacterales bacterium]|nr:hypothetical protein [Desulfobacterales bacterium]
MPVEARIESDYTLKLAGELIEPAPIFRRNSVAYKQDGSMVTVDNPRFETSVFGQGIMIEEGASNIVPTWPTGWTVSGNAGMSAVDQGVQPGAAGNTVRLTNSGATEGEYSSPLFALSPSTTYTLRIKARGTVAPGTFDAHVLSNTGTLIQLDGNLFPGGAWSPTANFQVIYSTFTTTADITGANQQIRFDHDGNDAGYIEIAEVTLIQKAYALSFPGYGATRAAEVMTVPTAGIFVKGAWTVEGTITPKIPTNVGNIDKSLFYCYIDASNYYKFVLGWGGEWHLSVRSNAVDKIISGGGASMGTAYSWMIAGNGSVIRLCVNGVQIGSDLLYTEPIGTLPANIYIGSFSDSTAQANGIIDDLRISSRARTLSEHQTWWNGGSPSAFTVDADTTLLVPFDGNFDIKLPFRLYSDGNIRVPKFTEDAGFKLNQNHELTTYALVEGVVL